MDADEYNGASWYVIEYMRSLLPDSKILDSSCGDGRNLVELAREGHDVTGVDISEVALGQARLALEIKRLTAKLVKGSLYDLRFPEGHFDAICYDTTNVHIEKPEL